MFYPRSEAFDAQVDRVDEILEGYTCGLGVVRFTVSGEERSIT